MICLVVAVISFFCFYLAGRLGKIQNNRFVDDNMEADSVEIVYTWSQIIILIKELVFAPDFLCVVFTNFIHSCRYIC